VPPKAAFALLRNSRKTDSLPAVKSAEFLLRLVLPKAAFALLRNTRKTDSLPAVKSAEFLLRLVPPKAAFALFKARAKRTRYGGLGLACSSPIWCRAFAAFALLRRMKHHETPRYDASLTVDHFAGDIYMEATCWHGEHDIRVRRTRHTGRERSGSRHSRFARRYCLYHNDGDLRFRPSYHLRFRPSYPIYDGFIPRDAPEGYKAFHDKDDGCIKVVMKPQMSEIPELVTAETAELTGPEAVVA
jgi:hypothetical protein